MASSGISVVHDDDVSHVDQSAVTLSVNNDGSVTIEIGQDSPASSKPAGGFDENLADRIDQSTLDQLASDLLESIDADQSSRKDWEETANLAARYLGIKLEEPDASASDGTISRHIATCLLEAVVKSWSTARAELLPVTGPVKVRRDDMPVPDAATPPPIEVPPELMGHNGGPPLLAPPAAPAAPGAPPPPPAAPPTLKPDELADALEQDLNWYLTTGDREYYPDFSKMLFSRALIGMAFRKVFRCPIRRRPVSVWVKAQNLIVSNDCSHLSGASRVTEVIRLRQSTMKRMQANGTYLDVVLSAPTGETTTTEEAEADIEGISAAPSLPADYEHMVYECACELDSFMLDGLDLLDKDENGKKPGYPLQYRVSIDKDTRAILEIRRDWKKGDDEHRRRRRYVKYGFIPGVGFYDLGLIHLLGNATMAATMIERGTVDAALFANFPGGMIGKGPTTRDKNTVFRPSPGEFVGVDMEAGTKLTDFIMPLPYKPPSAEAMAMGDKLTQKARDLAGIVDLPVGEGRIGNTPVGTIMSYIEAVAQVPGAVHKDDYVAQAEEFELLRELFADDPSMLWRGNKTPAHKWEVAEELMLPDLIPAADPNTPSSVHRLMKMQQLISTAGQPQFQGIANQRGIWSQLVKLMGAGSPEEFTIPEPPPGSVPPPPPDPRIVAAQIKAKSQAESDQAKQQMGQMAHQERMGELQQEGQQRDADRQSDETRAAMTLEAARMKAQHDTHNAAQDRASDQGIAAAGHQQNAADRAHNTAIAGAGIAQKHAQHLNEFGLAAAGQQQQAAADAAPDPSTDTPSDAS